MGMNRSEYLGPFIHCTTTIVSNPMDIRACVKEGCSAHNSRVYDSYVEFCQFCGSKIQHTTVFKEQTAVSNPHDILDEFDESLSWFCGESWNCPDNVHVFVPNRYDHKETKRAFHMDDQETGIWEIVNQDAEIEWLKGTFKIELTALRKQYGAKNVKVKWGLLAAWS